MQRHGLLEDRLREPRQNLVIADAAPNLHLQGQPLIGEGLQIRMAPRSRFSENSTESSPN
jgi:hypothetical protein